MVIRTGESVSVAAIRALDSKFGLKTDTMTKTEEIKRKNMDPGMIGISLKNAVCAVLLICVRLANKFPRKKEFCHLNYNTVILIYWKFPARN